MPDGPIRFKDWLPLLPEGMKRTSAYGAAALLVCDRLITRDPGVLGAYTITEKGKQRRAEVQALLADT